MCISVHDEILFGAAPTQHIVSLYIDATRPSAFLLLYTFEKHYIHMNSVRLVFFFILSSALYELRMRRTPCFFPFKVQIQVILRALR